MAVSIIGDSGFAEYDIIGYSFIAVSIIGDSVFAEYGIIRDSIMSVSIIGDSRYVFLPLYTKFRNSKVSSPKFPAIYYYSNELPNGTCFHGISEKFVRLMKLFVKIYRARVHHKFETDIAT
jgi:hypothetical protein